MTENQGGNVGTVLYTISGVTTYKWFSVVPDNTTDKFRYIWFMSGADSWGNMAEVEFYKKTGVDKSLLNDRITFAGVLSASDYTVATWTKMQTALNAAKALPAGASQDQVDAAANALKAALAGLVGI